MEKIDCVVIGAGVVGLAIARALALQGREVIVVEAEKQIGMGTSSRNSEVIHAGLYYDRDSLKARFCVAGKQALYAYCDARGVPVKRCGKLIVATDESQVSELRRLQGIAAGNGVNDLRMLSAADAKALEPDVECVAALLSPSTGILDSHGFMVALRGDAENAGATFAFQSPVTQGRVRPEGIEIQIGGNASDVWLARTVVNCAGLHASGVAASISGLDRRFVPRTYYAKGNYFSCAGRSRFRHLIYPVPVPGGLGVHLTLDMGMRPRFGPDVEWLDTPAYDVAPSRANAFYAEIRKYWPGLPDGALQPDYAGVRPKLAVQGQPAADFRIDDRSVHGVPGLVNLFGIESPGLTSALAIGDYVATRLAGF
jgi:L-2-hydroxyglutarate oxidase LhgO